MRKIHCLNAISKYGTDLLNDNYALTGELQEADGILVRSASMHEMEFSDSLLAIARAGAGVNNIPLDACAEKGIVVFNTPGANANGVKELVLAGLLLASRDVIGGIGWCKDNKDDANIAKTTEKSKKAFAGCEIKGKKLGVIGLGAIGVLVANAAAGLGITLTAASTMIFYSLDYSMSNFEQAKARIHRAGQTENCHYIYLVCKDTVDRKVLYALRKKINLAKMLVDDYRQGKNPFKS